MVKAGLAETLSGPGPFTVFAPDKCAFLKLPAALAGTLMDDVDLLKEVLMYHVVSGDIREIRNIFNDILNEIYYIGDTTNISYYITFNSVQGSPLRANVFLRRPKSNVS